MKWSWLDEAAHRSVTWLLRLYPPGFRARYSDEMETTFGDRWLDARRRGVLPALILFLRTVTSLLAAAVRERWERRGGRKAGWSEEYHGPGRRREGVVGRMGEDIRYSLRTLKRHPAFTVVVLATLALGIGMNTAVFSVLYSVMFGPLPYGDADRLVQVGRLHPSVPGGLFPLSNANFDDMRERARSLSSLEAAASTSYVLTERGEAAARHAGARVTVGMFDMLQVTAALGRTFTQSDGEVGGENVVVISDAFWRTQLGADPRVVGSTIRLNDEPYTVVGVMPRDFTFAGASLWTPLRLTPEQWAVRGSNYLRMYARLQPGATVESASAELAAAWAPIREAYPAGNEDTTFGARTFRDLLASSNRTSLLLLTGAAGFVLLIACANVANLMMVRAERRQREVGVRAALGAGRGRLATQFLTEGIITAVIGGVLGIAVAWAGLRALIGVFGGSIPRSTAVGLNLPVLAFTLGASLLTGLLVGLAPALRRGPDFQVLREGGRGGTARFSRLARTLVVAEVALAIMLVTGAGLLLKSYARATNSDLGFNPEGLVAVNYWFPSSVYPDGAQQQQFLERLLTTLQARQEISGAAMASLVPIREFGNNYTEIGSPGREARASFVEQRFVTPQFFDALGIPMLRGRTFTESETSNSNALVIINRTLARQLFADEDPLGESLSVGGNTPQIIGVVEDTRDYGPDQVPRPTMFFPTPASASLLVRSALPTGQVASLLRSIGNEIDSNVQIVRVQDMDEIQDAALSGRRFQLTLIGVFAVTALVLACVGIYGVLSYTVERQTREIGVRMALGARAARVASQVAWRGGRLALLGVILGSAGAFGLKSFIAAQLFNVQAFDAAVYFGVSGLVLAVATIACLVPARRASVIDPVHALNVE